MAEPMSHTHQQLGYHSQAASASSAALDASDTDSLTGYERDGERETDRPSLTLPRWLLHKRLLSDYATLAVLGAIALVTNTVFKPFERPIDAAVLADVDLRHPLKQNIVPTWALGLTSFAAPLLINAVAQAAVAQSVSAAGVFKRVFRFALSLSLTLLLTVISTNMVKKAVGRFRPDFLDRCQWSVVAMACTGDPAVVREGRVSFPSGHSSFAFAGSTLLALWTARMLNLYSRPNGFQGALFGRRRAAGQRGSLESGQSEHRNHRGDGGGAFEDSFSKQAPRGLSRAGRFYVLVLSFVPMWAAAYIAITRLQQFVHHPTDVLSGALLGSCIALVVYSTQFWREQSISSVL
ncbi:phosphatidic acid phosphatase type 2/haloperoxidase [Chytriomyces cf. hyalinus JEL632]|nr:phosphatidic acid phosphatase type 2/haloperoxidase [Chytriomyces cf. hyalinus JEL632]